MSEKTQYQVFDRMSGEMLAYGTTAECAEALGITQGSFHSLKSKARNGNGRYLFRVAKSCRITQELTKRWDDMRHLFDRGPELRYPCTGCMRRSICAYTDLWCDKWEAWYRAEFDKTADRLRVEGRLDGPR